MDVDEPRRDDRVQDGASSSMGHMTKESKSKEDHMQGENGEPVHSSILEELGWRGLIKQQTHQQELDEALAGDTPVTLYCGFDPTADSLHAGSLLPIVALAHFRRHGHDPIALVGGATGLIGDPSGKSTERELSDEATVQTNIDGISVQLRAILDRVLTMHTELLDARVIEDEARQQIPIVNNADWMKPWSFIGFLRDIGKHFRVNAMMARDSVKDRLENRDQGISYTEFSYMLIQAYDFLHLSRDMGCTLQVGGSDQWGNITAGTDLIRRTDSTPAFGLTLPLLTDAQGRKYGKSEGNAIWLDKERTSPYDFYQYWYNLDDEEIPRLLRCFTFLPEQEIEELSAQIERKDRPQEVKSRFAHEVTWLVHGKEEADKAVRVSRMLFGEEISGLTDRELSDLFKDAPSIEIASSRLNEGVPIADLLVEADLEKSKGAARRLLKQNGVYINNKRFGQEERDVTSADLSSETMLVLRAGKKKQCVVKVV